MFWPMLPLTVITAISNEIAIVTFLQIDVINLCDAARSTHNTSCRRLPLPLNHHIFIPADKDDEEQLSS